MNDNDTLIDVENISKTYHLGDSTVSALKNVSIKINAGEFVTLIGRSGSGKSTLLNIISGIDEEDEGNVLFKGNSLKAMSEKEKCHFLNKNIGFIFQNFNLINVLNVEENVALPTTLNQTFSSIEKKTNIQKIIEQVGLKDFRHHRPSQLSGGQRQRVAIARALVNGPDLIIADEPTANLDSQTAFMILDLMEKLNRENKVTFVFSTHDEKILSRIQRKIHLNDGKIVET